MQAFRRISLAELEAASERFDAAAEMTPQVDAYCSSTAWVLSAHEAFHPEQEAFVWEGPSGWLVLARGQAAGLGRYLAPLEAMWGLSSPLLAASPGPLVRDAARALDSVREEWDALWLCGLAPDSELFQRLAMSLGRDLRLFVGPATHRHVADLEGGVHGFLGRRSRRLRKSLRVSRRRAEEVGITWQWIENALGEAERLELYARLVDVDDRSWKGRASEGISAGGLWAFYDRMTARLAPRGRLRAAIATLDGQDVAMGFGALFGDTFRGLQMSYDDRFRSLGLGNLVQLQLVERLCAEGVRWYDLGTDMDYKQRWAEPGLQTVALVARP